MKGVRALLAGAIVLATSMAYAQAPTEEKISEALLGLGIGVSNIQPGERSPGSSLPNSYDQHLEFSVESVAPKGGQIFTCTKPKYCEAIYSYFDALRGLAGPYIFKSPSGLVVAQLNSGLSVKEAEKIESMLLEMK